MHMGFQKLFDACDRSIMLLGDLQPAGRPPSPREVRAIAVELMPLLADLGDFADDHDIDEGPLCDARACLSGAAEGEVEGTDLADVIRDAARRIQQIRTAVHVEGHRRLRAAMLGIH